MKSRKATYRGERRIVARVIVEEALGRELSSDEIVHHIDENPQNNELDNLLVVTKAEHIKLHKVKRKRLPAPEISPCFWCRRDFKLTPGQRYKYRLGQTIFFCSRACYLRKPHE